VPALLCVGAVVWVASSVALAERSDERTVWTPEPGIATPGDVSGDGRYVAYGDLVDLEVHVRDLARGTSRAVTHRAADGAAPNDSGSVGDRRRAFSPDNRQLAYSWRIDGHAQLRVADVSGSSAGAGRVLLDGQDVQWISALGWSPDSDVVVAALARRTRRAIELIAVTVADGRVSALGNAGSDDVRLSPDGRFLAYLAPMVPNTNEDTIMVMPATGGASTGLVTGQHLRIAGWSPDGTEVAYLRDQGSSTSLWATPFPAQDHASRHLADLGSVEGTLGLTRAGTFFYLVRPTMSWRTKVGSIDFDTGVMVAPPEDATTDARGLTFFPEAFSPDGRLLASVSKADRPEDHLVSIRDLASGRHEEVSVKLTAFGRIVWGPDGRSFAVMGFEGVPDIAELATSRSLYRVDATSGAVQPLVKGIGTVWMWSSAGRIYYDVVDSDGRGGMSIEEYDTVSHERTTMGTWTDGDRGRAKVALSPDARTLYIGEPDASDPLRTRIVAHDVATGVQRELFAAPLLGALTVVAGGAFVQTSVDGVAVLVPTAGGPPRRLPTMTGAAVFPVAWAPDGRSFVGQTTGVGRAARYWWVPLDARRPRELHLGVTGIAVDFLTNGRRIAFVERSGPADALPAVRTIDVFRAGARR
jgi:WD40 repeat protein